jgi:hypothetical protein
LHRNCGVLQRCCIGINYRDTAGYSGDTAEVLQKYLINTAGYFRGTAEVLRGVLHWHCKINTLVLQRYFTGTPKE